MSARKTEIPQFFNPREVGRGLSEVAVDVIKSEGNKVTSRWFHGNQDVDLFLWLDDSRQIIKQQLSMLGAVVEWNALEGLRTGWLLEFENEQGVKGTDIVQFDSNVNQGTLRQALEIIENIGALNSTERQDVLANFKSSQTYRGLDPAGFVDRYGKNVETAKEPIQIKRWVRFLRKMFGKY